MLYIGFKKICQSIIIAHLSWTKNEGDDWKEMYQSIQNKFLPWVCLMHLDLATSVSFRGYKVIMKIEFYNQPDQ